MSGLYDEDGIDGPWEKAMAKAIDADLLGRAKARHPGAAGNAVGSRPSPTAQLIYGYPFGPDPKHPELADYVQCLTCGTVVDVGGELRAHVNDHQAEKYEALE